MPFALLIIGLLMIITGINNNYSQFASQLSQDFSGSKSFLVWVLALGAVGALGYIKDLRTFSHYFMALILISMILANKGVFAQFQTALAAGPKTPQATADSSSTTPQALSSASSTAQIDSAIQSNQSGLQGQPPSSPGQAWFNGWANYLTGRSTNSAGATSP